MQQLGRGVGRLEIVCISYQLVERQVGEGSKHGVLGMTRRVPSRAASQEVL
jgi:hypothetical protein